MRRVAAQRLQATREGLSTMPVWHRAACRSLRAVVAACVAAGALAGRRVLAPPRRRPRPIPRGGRRGARLLALSAAPSRPAVARFATGLAGWTLLGPGAVTVRAGGPGGHYAALRDNTTLETPPLAGRRAASRCC